MDAYYDDVKQNLIDVDLYDPKKDSRGVFLQRINLNPHSIIVAEWNGVVVGNVFIIMDNWTAFFFRLAVRKKVQKAGIGTQLLEQAVQHLMHMGIKEVFIFVEQKNKKILNFFKKQKYTVTENYSCLMKKLA